MSDHGRVGLVIVGCGLSVYLAFVAALAHLLPVAREDEWRHAPSVSLQRWVREHWAAWLTVSAILILVGLATR